jgi:hypothetical protein
MSTISKVIPFPQSGAEVWLDGYHQARLTQWVAERPGHGKHCEPTQLTQTLVELYLSSLKEQGYSVSSRAQVKERLQALKG